MRARFTRKANTKLISKLGRFPAHTLHTALPFASSPSRLDVCVCVYVCMRALLQNNLNCHPESGRFCCLPTPLPRILRYHILVTNERKTKATTTSAHTTGRLERAALRVDIGGRGRGRRRTNVGVGCGLATTTRTT